VPANLPPQYVSAEGRLKSAKDPGEKIAILEEMWALLPKHKGTDKIQADIKRRISRLRDEEEKTAARRKGFSVSVVREGAGQIVAAGPPNTGKSSLVSVLAHHGPKIAPYPFTTLMPFPAMMPHLDVKVQLVDLPPIAPGHLEFWMINMLRNADASLLVLDASDGACLDRAGEVIGELARRHLALGEDTRTLIVANKMDLDGAAEGLELLRELWGLRGEVVPFSCLSPSPAEVDALRARAFGLLGVIRIYAKEPGRKPDMEQPFTVRDGSTVHDFAAHVHKDFASGLKQARVWGSARFPGQAVARDHPLRDGDVVELSL
jgi:uncharacterized protein